MKNNADIIRILLDNGADINFKDKGSKTSLIYAVQEQNAEAVKILLKYKANPNIFI